MAKENLFVPAATKTIGIIKRTEWIY